MAGFLLATAVIWVAQWRGSRPPDHQQAVFPPPSLPKVNADQPVASATKADSGRITDCQRRIDGLLSNFPLKFDQQSEMLKAEVQHVVYAVIEVIADCPYATLEIRATHAAFSSEGLRDLIWRRANYLQERIAAGGVRTRIVSRDMAADAGVKPAATIALAVVNAR